MSQPQEREQRRAALREVLDAPTEKERAAAELQRLDAEEAAERESAARSAAQERMLGITRAVGGLVSALDEDGRRPEAAAQAYAESAQRLTERCDKLQLLRAEALALVDRFAVAGPPLAAIAPPALLPAVRAALAVVQAVGFAGHGAGIQPATEQCEHRLRERRTYAEIAGTDGYAIIRAAELRPWPPLSPRQEQILADREREAAEARRQAARFAAEVEIVRSTPRACQYAG